MTARDLETLFDYSYWANRKLFDVVSRLTPEQFTGTVDGTHGSVRNTLVHVLNAERIWLGRVGGPEPGAALDPADFPTAESVFAVWKTVEAQLRALLSTLQDQDLDREVEFTIGGAKKLSMPVGELLQQAATHGVHHRGQMSLLLRLLGYSPENFDILLYYIETHRSRTS
ncbi:MAG: DinB family protein [Planctomycetes bacterium]|nr:DinB family protein [Planctomycetota bacterium]